MRISDWSSDVCSSDLAATGKSLWKFDPEVPGERAVHACCDVVNRGVAVWGDKLFVGAPDGRLSALDRKTGKVLWATQTFDSSNPSPTTGAPRVVQGMVLIHNRGAEIRGRGHVPTSPPTPPPL